MPDVKNANIFFLFCSYQKSEMLNQIKIPGILIIIMFSYVSWTGCDKSTTEKLDQPTPPIEDTTKGADIVSVSVSGGSIGIFNFAVGISSRLLRPGMCHELRYPEILPHNEDRHQRAKKTKMGIPA